MLRATIINKIKARLDELSPFSSVEINPSISLIDEMLDDCANSFLLSVPIHLLNPENFSVTTNTTNQDGSGWVRLQPDFLRLYAFKMTEWDIPVYEAIHPGHPKYRLQFNLVTRGGHAKPVVIIEHEISPDPKILRYYSLDDPQANTIETALYIPRALAEDIEDSLIVPFVWFVASDVFIAMNETEASNAAKQRFADIILTKTT